MERARGFLPIRLREKITMTRITMVCLLLLSFAPEPAGAEQDPDRAEFDGPALWIAGVSNRREFGVPPQALPETRGRLWIGQRGIRYAESTTHPANDLVAIPLERIRSSRAEATAHEYDLLFVNTRGGPPNAHLFLLPHARDAKPGASAMKAKRVLDQQAVEWTAARAGETEAPVTSRAKERIAISVTPLQPAVAIGSPLALPPARNARSTTVAEGVGALGWGMACGPCGLGMCGPVLMAACLATYVGGSALASLVDRADRRTEEVRFLTWTAHAQPMRAHIESVSESALGKSALRQCLQHRLSRDPAQPLQWEDGQRIASFEPVTSSETPAPGAPSPYPELSRDGIRHAIEIFVTRIWLAPRTSAGDAPTDARTAIVVEGGLRFVDTATGTADQRTIQWHADPRRFGEWDVNEMSAVTETVRQACHGFAELAITEAEDLWSRSSTAP
jgi:hypothetical protein